MTDRIESVKAGILSALSLTLVYIAIALGNNLLLAQQVPLLKDLQSETILNLLVKVAIAFLSGFLFGVTYRYIIRDDDNPHLKSGAVLAFGLVRGLAPIEGQENLTEAIWLLAVWVIESIICFAIASFTLNWAISQNWLKPFTSIKELSPSQTQPPTTNPSATPPTPTKSATHH